MRANLSSAKREIQGTVLFSLRACSNLLQFCFLRLFVYSAPSTFVNPNKSDKNKTKENIIIKSNFSSVVSRWRRTHRHNSFPRKMLPKWQKESSTEPWSPWIYLVRRVWTNYTLFCEVRECERMSLSWEHACVSASLCEWVCMVHASSFAYSRPSTGKWSNKREKKKINRKNDEEERIEPKESGYNSIQFLLTVEWVFFLCIQIDLAFALSIQGQCH